MTNGTPGGPANIPDIESIVGALNRGAVDEARRSIRGLLAADPPNWSGWHLASIVSTMGGGRPALATFRRAVSLSPGLGELWASLAAALESRQERRPALQAARRAIVLTPAVVEAMINFGVSLRETGEWRAAGAWLDRARALKPDDPALLNNRALVHLSLGQLGDAAATLRRAVDKAPTYGDALLNLAIVERRLNRPSASLPAIALALALSPGDSGSLAELGTILVTIGEAPAGAVWLRRALASDTSNTAARASHLGALSYVPGLSEAERRAAYGRAAAQARSASDAIPLPPAAPRDPGRRLTIGYASAKWHAHPMTQQLSGLLANHRRDRVRTIAYADQDHRDAMTRRLATLVDGWRETTGLTDRAMAEMVRADGVDILVFLALHEEGSRRSLPCLKAAPVQVSLHDIATSGLAEIDAWLTDPILHPEGTSEWFSEALVRVPSLFLFSALDDGSPQPAHRAAATVSFASFNNPAKLSLPTLSAWAEILRRVPDASLMLKYQTLFDDPMVAGRIRRIMSGHGIAADRLRLETGALTRPEHMAAVAAADVVLDPFPYNGNTATIEALWAGTPVVSLAGSRFLGRMGAAILARAGLGDLAVETVEDYVATAVSLARDVPRRQALRERLRGVIRQSPLFDGPAHARGIEDALFAIARRAGLVVTA